MALSREILKRLNDEDEPLAKRLKLAENTFCKVNVSITRKEDLILQWLCNLIKMDSTGLKTLEDCLNLASENRGILLSLETKELLIDALIGSLKGKNDNWNDSIFSCCAKVLGSSLIQQHLKWQPKKTCLLLKTLLKTTLKKSKANPNLDTQDHVVKAVESIIQIHKFSESKDEFVAEFFKQVLFHLCKLIDMENTDRTNRLGAEAHKCIQQLAFGKSRMQQYKEYTVEDTTSVPSLLFAAVKKHNESDDLDGIVKLHEFIFRAAVGNYKQETSVIDSIFRTLTETLENASNEVKTNVLNSYLKHMTDLHFDFENKVNDVTLLSFLKSIFEDIVKEQNLFKHHYVLLLRIITFNPLVIESHLSVKADEERPNVMKKVLLCERRNDEEKSAYDDFMIEFLRATSLLRRETKIVPCILMSLIQLLKESDDSGISAADVLPKGFTDEFTKLAATLTSSQINEMFSTFVYHLGKSSLEAVENVTGDNCLFLDVTVRLLTSFLTGIRIYEHTFAVDSQEKFFKHLETVGNSLEKLMESALTNKRSTFVMASILSAIIVWNRVYVLLAIYAPMACQHELKFPVKKSQWKKLLTLAGTSDDDEFKKSLNKLTLHRLKSAQEDCPGLDKLMNGFELSWLDILGEDSEILHLLNTTQCFQLATTAVHGIKSIDSAEDWKLCFSQENVQENVKFVKAVVLKCFAAIKEGLVHSVSKSLIKIIQENMEEMVEKDSSDILNRLKSQTNNAKWVVLSKQSNSNVKIYLEILLELPLMYLDAEFRSLIFLITYAISRELESSKKISVLCQKILTELCQRPGIDLFSLIDPVEIVCQLPNYSVFVKMMEQSLKNQTTYSSIKHLVKKKKIDKYCAVVLLESIDKVKGKLSSQQKSDYKKIEEKLIALLAEDLQGDPSEPMTLRCLILLLKTKGKEDIDSSLEERISAAVDKLFLEDKFESLVETAELQEPLNQGLQLVEAILKSRSSLKIKEAALKRIWEVMMRNPRQSLLPNLLQSTELKNFKNLTVSLLSLLKSGLMEENDSKVKNVLTIWENIAKVDMANQRNSIRLSSISNLFEILILTEMKDKYWIEMFKLLEVFLNAKHFIITEANIDMLIISCSKCLEKLSFSGCRSVLNICLALARSKTNFITDRLPAVMSLYRSLCSLIVAESKKSDCDQREVRTLSLDIEKLTMFLVKLKKDMMRISPYIIADLMSLFAEGVVPSYAKGPLENSVGQFLSICDQHAISFLSRALQPAANEIFKSHYHNYLKFQKFTGKI